MRTFPIICCTEYKHDTVIDWFLYFLLYVSTQSTSYHMSHSYRYFFPNILANIHMIDTLGAAFALV